ncbi:hypothetical protein AAON49_03450 [Pseudotenacibaculum sp. MALMAid0570]|uniref:hypothetical protein n=1 Tax=Pseudotenacibaculum sp. MALMAid0570 TaxID=3143938 RepID=UPI0032DEB805
MNALLIDSVGYLGLVLNLYSMSKSGEYKLRLFSLIANVIYIIYGFLIAANPVIIGCMIAVGLHAYHLRKIALKKIDSDVTH